MDIIQRTKLRKQITNTREHGSYNEIGMPLDMLDDLLDDLDERDRLITATFGVIPKSAIIDEMVKYVADNARLRKVLSLVAPWVCPHCGPHTKVDEDGCCVACGSDATLAMRKEYK